MAKYSKDQSPFQHLWLEGYDFKFGAYLKQGLSSIRSYPFGYLGHILLAIFATVIVSLATSIVSAVGLVVPTFAYTLTQVVGWFVTAFFLAFIAGIFYVARERKRSGERSFDNFFKGFNDFGQILLYSITYGAIVLVINLIARQLVDIDTLKISFEQLGASNPANFQEAIEALQSQFIPEYAQNILLYGGLVFVLTIYFNVAWSFTLPIITMKKVRFWEAMEISRKVITQKWFSFFGLYFTLGAIFFGYALLFVFLMAGVEEFLGVKIITALLAVAFIFTLFLFIPYVYLTQYAAFEDILMEDDGYEGMIDDIGKDDDMNPGK